MGKEIGRKRGGRGRGNPREGVGGCVTQAGEMNGIIGGIAGGGYVKGELAGDDPMARGRRLHFAN